jgi:hypothetical protein
MSGRCCFAIGQEIEAVLKQVEPDGSAQVRQMCDEGEVPVAVGHHGRDGVVGPDPGKEVVVGVVDVIQAYPTVGVVLHPDACGR